MNNIILATDDNYAVPCMVTIASILSNNSPQKYAIHVITEGLNETNSALFKKLQDSFSGSSIKLKKVDTDAIKGAITSTRFPIANFFRLMIPDLFDFDKALYLDCDIIVNRNIDNIWDINIEGKACGMVEDQACEDITLHNRIEKYTPYYNAGVLLMNLKVWREKKIASKLIQFMADNPEKCLYPDQDAINHVLCDSIVPMPYTLNFQERWYEPQQYWLMHKSKWNDIEEAKKKPQILHYTGPQKPWMEGCSHPLADLFFKYKKIVTGIENNIEDDKIKTRQESERKREERERKRRHKHIRRANLFMILFAVETLAVLGYIIYSLVH